MKSQRYNKRLAPDIEVRHRGGTLFVVLWLICLLICPVPVAAETMWASADIDHAAAQGIAPGTDAEPSRFHVDEVLRERTFLPAAMRVTSPALDDDRVLPGLDDMEADVDRLLGGMDDQTAFWGVYFRSDVAQDLDSGDSDLAFRLEWDLFKHGRYERKKELDKKRNQSKLQTLQMLNDVNQHGLNQRLDEIELLTQALQYHQAEELATLLAGILERRRVQLDKGYITRDDFDHIRFKYRQAVLKKKLFAQSRNAALDASVHGLLNCGEFLSLKDIDVMQQMALDQAYALKIQQNLAERAQYVRSWADDLSVDLYVEQRDDFNANRRSNVGFEVKVPIHWYTRRGDLIDREKKLYKKQAAVLTRRIETNIGKLYDFFAFQQHRILTLLLELEKSAQRKAYERERAKRALEDLNYTPERSLDLIRIEEIDLRYEAIQTRLKLYEILVKIAALTHSTHPRDVIAGTQNSCTGH